MEELPADLKQRLAAAADSAPLLAHAARERRRTAQRRALLLHRQAVEQELAATERRLRPLLRMALGQAVGLLALPAALMTLLVKEAPPADLHPVEIGLPYTLLAIALLTMALGPYAFRPYLLLTRAFLVRALLIYALLEEGEQVGHRMICAVLSETRGSLVSLPGAWKMGVNRDNSQGVRCAGAFPQWPTVPRGMPRLLVRHRASNRVDTR